MPTQNDIGRAFVLDLAKAYESNKEDMIGGKGVMAFGHIIWYGSGPTPSESETSYYDWIDLPSGARTIGADDGTLELEITDVDDVNGCVTCYRPNTFSSPRVCLLFDEFEEFGLFE